MVAFRSLLLALLAPFLLLSQTSAQGLFETESSHHLAARQGIVNGNICTEVDLTLLGIVIARDVCICLAGGALTPASILRVNQQITANQGVLAPVINVVGGLAGAITRVTNALAPAILSTGSTTCRYPANSYPNQCGGCGYECIQNSTVTYVPCGSFCILAGAGCVSGVPTRKRWLETEDISARCPIGYDACLLPGSTATSLSSSSGFECLKTQTDLESCGGCVNPLPGRPAGVDCSAIPNIGSASCVAGKCQIDSCAKGYTFDGKSCVESGAKKLAGYWAALQDASKITLQV